MTDERRKPRELFDEEIDAATEFASTLNINPDLMPPDVADTITTLRQYVLDLVETVKEQNAEYSENRQEVVAAKATLGGVVPDEVTPRTAGHLAHWLSGEYHKITKALEREPVAGAKRSPAEHVELLIASYRNNRATLITVHDKLRRIKGGELSEIIETAQAVSTELFKARNELMVASAKARDLDAVCEALGCDAGDEVSYAVKLVNDHDRIKKLLGRVQDAVAHVVGYDGKPVADVVEHVVAGYDTLAKLRNALGREVGVKEGQELDALDDIIKRKSEYDDKLANVNRLLQASSFANYDTAATGVGRALASLSQARAESEALSAVVNECLSVCGITAAAELPDRVRGLFAETAAQKQTLGRVEYALANVSELVQGDHSVDELVGMLASERRMLYDRSNKQAAELREWQERHQKIVDLAAAHFWYTSPDADNPSVPDLLGLVTRMLDQLSEGKADAQRVSDVLTVLVREGVADNYDTDINAVGRAVALLASRFHTERVVTQRLLDELREYPTPAEHDDLKKRLADLTSYPSIAATVVTDIKSADTVLRIARLFHLDEGVSAYEIADTVLAHVVSVIADKEQLREFVDMILNPLGVKYEGDMPSVVNEVNLYASMNRLTLSTLVALQAERARAFEYLAGEHGVAAHADIVETIKAAYEHWHTFGDEIAGEVCAVLDREMIDGDGLTERVERLVTLLREAEGTKDRGAKLIAEAHTLDDMFGFGRNLDNDRVGALKDMLEKFAQAENRAERAEWNFNRLAGAAFDEYATARAAFMYGVGDFDDLDTEGRLEAFDRWYRQRPTDAGTPITVDRRKLAFLAYTFGARTASGQDNRTLRAMFDGWYDEMLRQPSEVQK